MTVSGWHFRISLFVSIFDRTRRFNKRTVNNRVFVEEKPFIGKCYLNNKNIFLSQPFFP